MIDTGQEPPNQEHKSDILLSEGTSSSGQLLTFLQVWVILEEKRGGEGQDRHTTQTLPSGQFLLLLEQGGICVPGGEEE